MAKWYQNLTFGNLCANHKLATFIEHFTACLDIAGQIFADLLSRAISDAGRPRPVWVARGDGGVCSLRGGTGFLHIFNA